jgi:hypothetical protein
MTRTEESEEPQMLHVYSCVELFLFREKKEGTGTEVWILLQITTFKDHRKHFISSLQNKITNIPDESCDNTWLFFLSYKSIFLLTVASVFVLGIFPETRIQELSFTTIQIREKCFPNFFPSYV